jgi:hypothetical protein
MNPENLTISSILGIRGSIITYFLNHKNIPKLDFDGLWKDPYCKGKITCYYIKVKRDKGEGKAEVVEGFVGIKDKELKPSEWRKSNSKIGNIVDYDYLLLFQTFYDNEKEIIFFPENTFGEFPQPYENNPFNQYKEKTLVVQIEAIRGRISKRQCKKKIEKIVKDAKPIPP